MKITIFCYSNHNFVCFIFHFLFLHAKHPGYETAITRARITTPHLPVIPHPAHRYVSKGPPRQQKKERTRKDVKKMADFQDGTTTKTAFRNLTEPIADPTTFNAIVQAVIVSNPFGCVSYMSAGETHAGVEKTKEAYTAKIVYQDTDAKVVGNISDR